MSRVTLQDVADTVGLSRSTVSKALNNYESIPLATRQRVKDIATQLGYRPNPLVSALMSQRSGNRRRADESPVIASLDLWTTPWREMESYAPCRRGVESQADALGYRIEYISMKEPLNRAANDRIAKRLNSIGVHGILVLQVPLDSRKIDMDWSKFCAVTMGPSLSEPAMSRVMPDHFRAVQMRFRHALSQGYKRIGAVVETDHDERMNRRISSAFLGSQTELNASDHVPLLRLESIDQESCIQWYKRHRPDYVLCNNRTVERWFQSLIRSGGSLREVDNWHFSLDSHFEDIGRVAIDYLVQQIHRSAFGLDQVIQEISILPTVGQARKHAIKAPCNLDPI